MLRSSPALATFTHQDREFCAATGIDPGPEPVVSMEAYCAVIAANDYITNENFQLRKQIRALEAELCEPRKWRTRQALLFGALVAAALLFEVFVLPRWL